ncbi:unnamed protein product [Fusarium graminearum]|nr:unnamed protein product [Fusarium graminearum]
MASTVARSLELQQLCAKSSLDPLTAHELSSHRYDYSRRDIVPMVAYIKLICLAVPQGSRYKKD